MKSDSSFSLAMASQPLQIKLKIAKCHLAPTEYVCDETMKKPAKQFGEFELRGILQTNGKAQKECFLVRTKIYPLRCHNSLDKDS